MPDRIVLQDRLYEAVLELAGIPRSHLDMLLAASDPVGLPKAIQQLIAINEARKTGSHAKEVDRAAGR